MRIALSSVITAPDKLTLVFQVPVYLQRCEEALNFEKDLAARYLHNHTEPMLKACLENYLLAELQVRRILMEGANSALCSGSVSYSFLLEKL